MLKPSTLRRRAWSLALAVACAGSLAASGCGAPAGGQLARSRGEVIVVGSFDFPESVLLAHIYAGALAARGLPVRVLSDLGSRELVDPALMNGLIQLVPEYAGSALQFISLGRQTATASVAHTNRALTTLAAGFGLVATRPAAAQDSNAIVVTAATAARHGLRSIADLAEVAPRLVFGGPPECPGRAYCLPGLRQTYGLHFKSFVPLDAAGPLTLQALEAGDIDVALLFTTNPVISSQHLVVLRDDRGLQPAENITPLVRRSVVTRYGPSLVAVLNAVSARLGTKTLRELDAQVVMHGQSPHRVAQRWLAGQALPAGEGANA